MRLLDQINQQARHERMLYDITKRIHGAPDIQSIIETTKDEVRKVVGSPNVQIEINFRTQKIIEESM